MKKMKKSVVMFLVLALMLSNTAFAAEGQSSKISGVEKLKNKVEVMKTDQAEFLASEEVMENWKATDLHQKLVDFIEKNNEFSTIFCGSYINDDNKLVVRLKEKTDRSVNTVQEAIKSEDIIIETGNITLAELKVLEKSYLDKVSELINQSQLDDQEKILVQDLVGFGIDEKTSKMIVRIYEIDEKKVNAFKTVFGDYNNTIFENAERPELTASWYTGAKINVANTYELTTGYRAYYINGSGTRKNGFVTAAHGCSVGNTVYGVISGGKVVLGTCILSVCTGSVDAAFVAFTNSSYTPSNTVSSSLASGQTILATIVATNSNLSVGTYVYTFGFKSGMKVGRITNNSYDFIHRDENYNVQTIYVDIAVVSCISQGGDSGGCVAIVKSGGYATAGTILGHTSSEGYFSKYENQNNTLGVVKY